MKLIFITISLFISQITFSQDVLRGNAFYVATVTATAGTCGVSDPDACRFIDSANTYNGAYYALLSATEKTAINNLVIALKDSVDIDSSLWKKLHAIYPMVGSKAFTMMWNLKDPRNLDTAYRLCWNSTCTGADTITKTGFASTGFTPNANVGAPIGKTFYEPAYNATVSSLCLSYYSRTNVSASSYEMGVSNSGGVGQLALLGARVSGTGQSYFDNLGATVAVSDSRGMFMANKRGATSNVLYRNGLSIASNVTSTTWNPAPFAVYIGCLNQGGTNQFSSTKECAFASIGLGLTATEARMLYNIVQAFETSLGRQM